MRARNPELQIRPERPADAAAVFRVQRDAFGREGEARLVDALRERARPQVSLVVLAEHGGAADVVGHVFFSPVRLVPERESSPLCMGLAPVGVSPAHQNRGVGDALCREGIEACRALGAALVFVLGHPTYYPRFGFEEAGPHGFTYGGRDAGAAFMLMELRAGAASDLSGDVCFHPAFDELEENA